MKKQAVRAISVMLILLVCGGCSRQENNSNDKNTIGDLTEEEEMLDPEIWDSMDQYEKIDWKMRWAKCKTEDFSYHVTEKNTVVIDAYTGTDGIIVIPEEIEGKPVEKVSQLNANNTVEGLEVKCNIEKEAFAGWTELKVVQLYGEIKKVGDYAFRDCPQLRCVYMGDGITDLGKGAFYGCEKLHGIQLSNGITILKEDTFAGCKALAGVELPDDLTEIEKGVFSGCVGIRFLLIPGQVAKMESFPEKAYMLTNKGTYGEQYAKTQGIHVTNDYTEIYAANQDNTQNIIDDLEIWARLDQYGKIKWKMDRTKYKPDDFSYHVTEEDTVVIDAYTGTDDIVVIPERIEGKLVVKVGQLNANNTVEGLVVKCNIDKEAFADWTELKVVQLYGEIKEVGDYAFRNCPQLETVYMSAGITDLGKGAFYGCENLCNIYNLSNRITVLKEDTFAGCKALFDVSLPDGLKEIEKGVFSGCVCIDKLVVSDQVEKIESFPEKAFMITGKGTYGEQYAKEHGIHIRDEIIVFY